MYNLETVLKKCIKKWFIENMQVQNVIEDHQLLIENVFCTCSLYV